jgi:hypothetical protein
MSIETNRDRELVGKSDDKSWNSPQKTPSTELETESYMKILDQANTYLSLTPVKNEEPNEMAAVVKV